MFNGREFEGEPGEVLSENECRTVELSIAFKRVRCYSCDFTAVYKIKVKEVRRAPLLGIGPEGEETSTETGESVEQIPRYAAIPETLKCEQCGEVLGLHTECIY